jgi:CBS domain-containing protein
MSPSLNHLIESKGREIFSISPGASVFDAIKMMAEKGVGLLLVMDDSQPLPVGVISERDYARKIILQGRRSRETAVADIMTSEITYGRPGQTVQEGMALMTNGRFRHLPIIEDGKVVGVLSIGDLVKAVIEEQQFRIDQLETYITS